MDYNNFFILQHYRSNQYINTYRWPVYIILCLNEKAENKEILFSFLKYFYCDKLNYIKRLNHHSKKNQ
jgi:hypothetical protein